MSVAKSISLARVKRELENCSQYAINCGWLISEIDEPNQLFTVKMISPIEIKSVREQFILEVTFDDYPEIPLLLEFIDPKSGDRGTKNAYPKGANDNFFHPFPCICNPCSRKSYKSYNAMAPHSDWNYSGWQTNSKVGTLKSVDSILKAIYSRISNPEFYVGRMA
nr:hypothetical protein [Nitrosomonas nitrosa]